MQKVQNIFPIAKVETNEKIIDLAETRQQIYCRVAIVPTGDESTLTAEQKELLSKLSDKQKNTTLKGQLTREISNIFPVSVFSDYIDGLDEISADADYFSADGQKEVIQQISDLVVKESFIFTYYTENVEALLKGTEYEGTNVLFAETNEGAIRPIRSRNNLYFGFFDSQEEAFSFMQSRLLSDIENEVLMLENPNGTSEPKPEPEPEQKPAKTAPKLQLKRK